MAIDILNIEPSVISRDLKGKYVLVYSQPKVGKTSFAASFPRNLLLAFEKGYNAIGGIRAVDINKWSDAKLVLRQLAKPEAQKMYDTVTIDTTSIAWDLCEQFICAQWKALPNYVPENSNILVMVDVSGSMMGRPMETSIGLGTYFAQRNGGDYHGLYMTFTDRPHFVDISMNTTLASCVEKVRRTDIGYSTNLDAAFQYVLNHALNNHIKNEDMPKALVVISDMEIDPYFRGRRNLDFVAKWKEEFARFGYTMPKLVMWNVEARNDTFLSQSNDVLLVSGQSASTFYNLCSALGGKTAWEFMCEVLNDPMYDCVVI